MQGGPYDHYKIYEESESTTALVTKLEDEDIGPNELSGDQNSEKSIFASSVEGQKANFFLTVTTIVKTVIGSSILAIPYSISQLGVVFGVIVFILATGLTHFGTILLLKAKNMSHHSNYSTIYYEVWNSLLAKGLGSLLIFLNNIGLCIAEAIILKQAIRKVLVDTIHDRDILDAFYTSEEFIVLLVALLETPLTLVRKMEKLKMVGLMGVINITIFMTSFTIMFLMSLSEGDPERRPVGDMNLFPDDWFLAAAAVPNVLLALSYQMNFFPIYKAMKNVTDSKIARASLCGTLFCTSSYLLVGILGYDYVGHQINANFLVSLSYDKVPPLFFYLINISFILSVYFAFPIMFFSGRNNFIALAKLLLAKKKPESPGAQRDELAEISEYLQDRDIGARRRRAKLHFILYTILIYLVVVGVTLGVEDIKPVFNVVGAICSTSIAILLPCFFYFRLIGIKEQPTSLIYYISIVLFCVMAPYAIFSILALYINPN